jgi:RNA polymerase sigma factor (sigma-70 family)
MVTAIAAGNPEGLAAAYDRYARSLFGYCRTFLREPADAADAVHDTFLIAASRVSGLRDKSCLRPWLYAVARNECVRRLRGKEVPVPEVPEQVPQREDTTAEQAELSALVTDALEGVTRDEREVLRLMVLQGLSAGETAQVLGVSRNHAHVIASRARGNLRESLGVLLTARTGREECRQLNAMLDGWDGHLDVPLRRQLARHISRCPQCGSRRDRELSPAALLGAAALPALALELPPGLRERVLSAGPARLTAAGHRAGAFNSHGFPVRLDPVRPWLAHPVHAAGTAVTTAATAAAATVVLVSAGHAHHGPMVMLPETGGTPYYSSAPVPHPSSAPAAPSRSAAGPSALAMTSRPAVLPSPAPSKTPPARRTPAPGPTARPTPRATPTPTPTLVSVQGTLTVAPLSLTLSALVPAHLTLTAGDGPVSWSVSEPATLLGSVTVSPSSGTLQAGQSVTVTVSASGMVSADSELVFSPGGETVTVAAGLL